MVSRSHSPGGNRVEGDWLDHRGLATDRMMPNHIQSHDGYHLITEELHRRVAAYWETHERDGEIKRAPPLPASGYCAWRSHSKCVGARAETCGCWCHE